jgi:hypothetical protein
VTAAERDFATFPLQAGRDVGDNFVRGRLDSRDSAVALIQRPDGIPAKREEAGALADGDLVSNSIRRCIFTRDTMLRVGDVTQTAFDPNVQATEPSPTEIIALI